MTPREKWHLFTPNLLSAIVVAIAVWLVYFVIEVTRTLHVWPA